MARRAGIYAASSAIAIITPIATIIGVRASAERFATMRAASRVLENASGAPRTTPALIKTSA